MGQHTESAGEGVRRNAALMAGAEAAVQRLDAALKDLQDAWNMAEGRRGRIADNRQRLSKEHAELEAGREALRQEQWKLKKESATLQHARDEVQVLDRQMAELTVEREAIRKQLTALLAKIKSLSAEIRS